MLEQKHRDMLIAAYEKFKFTKDREDIDDAISLVKLMAPEKFFQTGGKDLDPALARRVFFNEPFSAHWSGRAIKKYGVK
jgi:hypothetical protein